MYCKSCCWLRSPSPLMCVKWWSWWWPPHFNWAVAGGEQPFPHSISTSKTVNTSQAHGSQVSVLNYVWLQLDLRVSTTYTYTTVQHTWLMYRAAVWRITYGSMTKLEFVKLGRGRERLCADEVWERCKGEHCAIQKACIQWSWEFVHNQFGVSQIFFAPRLFRQMRACKQPPFHRYYDLHRQLWNARTPLL